MQLNSAPPVAFETTLMVRDACLCFQTQRAARELARVFDQAFQPLTLTNGQFSMLMALNRPEAPSLGKLSDELGMDRTTMTASVKVLERRGLLQTERNPQNRRMLLLKLTKAGYDVLKEALPVWEKTLADIKSRMAGETPDGISRTIGTLASAARTSRKDLAP